MTFPLKNLVEKRKSASPIRSYLWAIELPTLKNTTIHGISTPPEVTNNLQSLSLDGPDISSRINTSTMPFPMFETDKTIERNSYWYYATTNDIGQISLEIFEEEDGATLKYLETWRNLIVNSDGTYNPPALYKRPIVFYRYNLQQNEIMKSTYVGYFIVGINELSNDYESNELVRYTVNFAGDSVSHDVISADVIGASSIDFKRTFSQNVLSDISDKVNSLIN